MPILQLWLPKEKPPRKRQLENQLRVANQFKARIGLPVPSSWKRGTYHRLNHLLTMPPGERFEYLNSHLALPPIVEEIKHQMCSKDLDDNMLMLWNTVLKFFIAALPEIDENVVLECSYQRLLPALQKLSGKVLSLSEAAEQCNLSPSYFAALFRKQFGLSFARYERNFRLNGAISAINHGTTFKEAAEEWGFFDKSHLARLIKQHK